MCRLCIYVGKKPIFMADLITRPTHSILRQSFASKERQNKDPLNGDGFGISWYNEETNSHEHDHSEPHEHLFLHDSPKPVSLPTPGVFVRFETRCFPFSFFSNLAQTSKTRPYLVTPAWNNLNLQRLAEKISSPLFFAHVRAATPGSLTSETNCHPFQFHHYTFMHNGNVAEFKRIKRKVVDGLCTELYNHLQGTTDSESSFMLFLEILRKKRPNESLSSFYFSPLELREAMEETIRVLMELSNDEGITEPSAMNFCVSDGRTVIATRFINHPTKEPASLYFASGSAFLEVSEGDYAMLHLERRPACHIIASEPLTKQLRDWIPVPRNSLIMVTRNDCNLLIFPIQIEA